MTLLQRQMVAVNTIADLVVLRIADRTFTLEFDAALTLSAAIRQNARLAKLSTGDAGRNFYGVGILEDADPLKPKYRRFMAKLPERLRLHDMEVGTEGALVTIRIHRDVAKLGFGDARELSQWIRVRGKEAKRRANEHAHWSTFVNKEW